MWELGGWRCVCFTLYTRLEHRRFHYEDGVSEELNVPPIPQLHLSSGLLPFSFFFFFCLFLVWGSFQALQPALCPFPVVLCLTSDLSHTSRGCANTCEVPTTGPGALCPVSCFGGVYLATSCGLWDLSSPIRD